MNRFFQYVFFRVSVFIFRILPFGFLYALARFIAFLLNKFIHYRFEVIKQNLSTCFPEKSEVEIRNMIRQYYRHFAYVLVEVAKGYRMGRKQGMKRYKVLNPELMQQLYDQGRSVILVSGHFNNWEWLTISFPAMFPHKLYAVYKPLKNIRVDRFIKRARSLNNVTLVPLKETGLMFRKVKIEPSAFVMLSDQLPVQLDKAHWLTFLGRETGFLHGFELYARKFDTAVVFYKVLRQRTGYYTIELKLITNQAQLTQAGEITRTFAAELESAIREQPAHWLWSHRRWKK